MKKHLCILFMFLATFAIVAHNIIPHHEHGEIVCFNDISCEDTHNETHSHKTPCHLSMEKIVRVVNDKDQQQCVHGDVCDYHFPPILLFLGNFFEYETPVVKINNKPYINLYASVELFSTNSLRAPPIA